MNANIPRLDVESSIQQSIALLVDHPFVCVENKEGYFEGILTRRTVLDQLNKHIRRLNKQ